MRGRFLIGRVRSLRESPRAVVPTMAVTGEGKDQWATTRKLLLMPRQNDIPGWVAVPGWQGPAVERRQAAATDNSMVSEHRRPRGTESARPGPVLMRGERVNPARVRGRCAGMRACGGRPTVRGAESRLAGQGVQEANAGGGNAAGNRGPQDLGTPLGWSVDNWPDTGPGARP